MRREIARRPRRILHISLDPVLLLKCEAGQDVVEYGLLIAVIALVVLAGLHTFGQLVEPWFVGLAGHVTTTGT